MSGREIIKEIFEIKEELKYFESLARKWPDLKDLIAETIELEKKEIKKLHKELIGGQDVR